MDVQTSLLHWVTTKLRTAVVSDITKDFCDGTVLMELVVLLIENDERAVSEALDKFTDTPTTMSHSLDNIKSALTCLAADGLELEVKPLDIFRGKREVIEGILEMLRSKYDSILPGTTSSTLTKQDIITGESTLTKQDIITDWARSVCEHTESLRQEKGTPLESDHSDHDTGFIDPSSNGSGGEEENGKGGGGGGGGFQITSSDTLLPDPRPQDESYSSIDVIEVDEKLVRADSKIVLSHESSRKACVFVSISMKYEVTDLAARESFLKQATKNYVLAGCEVLAHKELHKLGLGFVNLLVTCSYTRSLRTKSVGIYSPFLLGVQTINIAENRQLFAHVLRGRIKLTAHQRAEHLKFTMKNISKARVHVVIPEGSVWQQVELNGDSHVITKESAVRSLYPEETEVVSIPSLYLNKQGGKSRGQPLALTPFVFRGPLGDQERLFGYSDPDEEGYFRFCEDCNGVIYRDMYGVTYYQNRPYHLECGPPCFKCGLGCLNCIIKEEDRPYCSLECYYLAQQTPQYCNRCGYVLAPSDKGMVHRRSCPKTCRICCMLCLDMEHYPGPVCSKLCQDWDTSKNRICQGCAQPITHKSTSIEIDNMFYHSIHCFKIRTTCPPLIIQRAMVRGKQYEVQELRRLCKLEFEKRSERRREALRLKKEERERKHNLQNVMECISKIEGINKIDGDRKYGTLQPTRQNKPTSEQRTRSLSSAGEQSSLPSENRKRTNTKPPELRRSSSETGSFLDLLFSSDDEEQPARPCRQFSRSSSERESQRKRPVDLEKRKLNRGFPTGERSARSSSRQRSRLRSAESDSSDTVMIAAPVRPSKRFLSLKRSASKGSTGSTSSSTSNPSPVPRMEFERPNLFDQLRCEQQIDTESNSLTQRTVPKGRSRYDRQYSAPSNYSSGRDRLQVSDNQLPSGRQSGSNSKDTMISRNALINSRNGHVGQYRPKVDHKVQVHREYNRSLSDEQSGRTHYFSKSSSSDGRPYSGKSLSPNDVPITNGYRPRRPSDRSDRSKSDKSDMSKVSPSFDSLFDDDISEADSISPRRVNPSSRNPTPLVRNIEDPLASVLSKHSRRHPPELNQRVDTPPRTGSSHLVETSPPRKVSPRADTPRKDVSPETETPRIIAPAPQVKRSMTEAQKRYERRFSRSRSRSKSSEKLALVPTLSYPVEVLVNNVGYSLEMIAPTEKVEDKTWRSPRLDPTRHVSHLEDALRHPSPEGEATLKSASSLDSELDMDIENALNELENEENGLGEDGVDTVTQTTKLLSLSGGVHSPYSLIRQDAGV